VTCSSARWPCAYCLRRPRREPSNRCVAFIVVLAIVVALVVAFLAMAVEAV
jgi:hypothetical protein